MKVLALKTHKLLGSMPGINQSLCWELMRPWALHGTNCLYLRVVPTFPCPTPSKALSISQLCLATVILLLRSPHSVGPAEFSSKRKGPRLVERS